MSFLSGRRGGDISRCSTRRRTGRPGRQSFIEQLEQRWLLSASPANDSTALITGSTSQGAGTQAAEEAAAGKSIDSFALDLYAQLQGTAGGNLFVSPFSAATALAMTYAGAGGETAQQMASVLHFSGDSSSTESELGALLGDLGAAGQSGGFLLNAANALWVQQGLNLLPEFLTVMQSDFSGALSQADFIDDADAVRQTINNWVAQQTNGKITDLFPAGTISGFTRLVLADAVYFKAAWSSPFDAYQTTEAPFTLASGSQVTASTMHQTGQFRYMESDGFQVLQLPYADGRMAMDILLPTQNGLAGLGSNQLPADINSWLDGLGPQSVAISLPKFQMTTEFNLIPTLKALGMTDAFMNGADFSGITDELRLKIDTVVQKAYISVDEAGTEAAAATGIGMTPAVVSAEPNPPVVFNADHPFLFLIRDTQSGTVLFIGQVEDPTQQGGDPSSPVITQQPRVDEPVMTPKTTTLTNAGTLTVVGSAATYTATQGAALSTTLATFSDTDSGRTASDFTATIDWGDGSTSMGVVSSTGPGTLTVSGSHVYSAAGAHQATIALADDAPGTASATANATVNVSAAPAGAPNFTITTTGPASANVGDLVTYSVKIANSGQPGDGTPQTFVHNLYRELLGREPDSSGDAFWIAYLAQHNNAAGRAQVIQEFLHSPEYARLYVTTLYEVFLGIPGFRQNPSHRFDPRIKP